MVQVAAEPLSWWRLVHSEVLMNERPCPTSGKVSVLQGVWLVSCPHC